MPGKVPSFVKESLWHMPQAETLILTDAAPGSGMSRSTSSKGPFGRGTWTTRIFDIVPPSGASSSINVFDSGIEAMLAPPLAYYTDETKGMVLRLEGAKTSPAE
jgi:hypothetical protein